MGEIEKILLVVFLILLTLTCLIVYVFLKKHLVNIVKKNSQVLNELGIINGKIKYKNIEQSYIYCYHCMSRAEFNHFVLDDYFVEIIGDNKNFFQTMIKAIKNNKKEKEKYKKLLAKVDFSQTAEMAKAVKIPARIYQHIE